MLFYTGPYILQDGEYYLNVTRTEENRLMSMCRQMEADLYCQDIPEDGRYLECGWMVIQIMTKQDMLIINA